MTAEAAIVTATSRENAMRLLMIPVLIAASGCSPKEARSVEYFEAHPAEAREIVEA